MNPTFPQDTVFYNDTISEGAWIITETMPEFPGGDTAFITYIKRHVHYPRSAIRDSIEGKVSFRFAINEVGIVENIFFLKSIHPDIDTQCINMLKEMPEWKPATRLFDSKKGFYWGYAKTWFLINLNFSLRKNKEIKGITITP